MWFTGILMIIAALHGSFGVQDGFLSQSEYDIWRDGVEYDIWRESVADGRYYPSIHPPHPQVLPPPSSSFDIVPRIGQAENHLRVPPAPRFLPHTVATDWENSWSPASAHLSSPHPHSQFGDVQDSLSNQALYQSTNTPERAPNHELHQAYRQNTAPRIGLAEGNLRPGDGLALRVYRKALESAARYLMDEEPSDPPTPYTTTFPHGVSPDLSSGFELAPRLVTTSSGTEMFQVLPHEPSNSSNPALGSSTGLNHISQTENELNQVVSNSLSDSQPSESSQGWSMGSKKKQKVFSSGGSHHQADNDPNELASKSFSGSGETSTKRRSSHISEKYSYQSRPGRKPKFTQVIPETILELEASPFVYISYHASRLQMCSYQRAILIDKTVTKWLPIYKKKFEFYPNNQVIKAKLENFFEQLWYMNTMILHSFNFYILNDLPKVYGAHDHMMSWVVHGMLSSKETLNVSEPPQNISEAIFQEKDVLNRISGFLRAETINKDIFFEDRNGGVNRVKQETLKACELAVYILEAYYRSQNPKRYSEVFPQILNLTERLIHYTASRRRGHTKTWKGGKLNMYGTDIIPWAEVDTSWDRELQKDEWDDNLLKQFKLICKERGQELRLQELERHYNPKRGKNKECPSRRRKVVD